MSLLHKFLNRSWADRVLLVRAFGLVTAVRVGLSVLPYRTVQRLTRTAWPPRRLSLDSPEAMSTYRRRVVQSVSSVGRRLLGDKPCLTQALVAQRMLSAADYETELKIGVTKDGQELLAHAWLERDGRIVIGGGNSRARYVPLAPVEPVSS